MATSLLFLRNPIFRTVGTRIRLLSTSSNNPSHHNHHQRNHEFLSPDLYLNSWKSPPKDPKEAETRLAQLRREYSKKVKEVRKVYIQEMEMMRLEKQRKDEASKEALRLANEERKAAKDAAKKVIAAQRRAEQEEFRLTLLKERTDKLEYWRTREKRIQDKKQEKRELLRRESSMWVDESELEKKILEAVSYSSTL